MSTYILLLTLTPEGREKMLKDSNSVLRGGAAVSIPNIQVLGLYGVLGDYDFVGILDAPDNDTAARFSLALGVEAGVHVVTLPAIPIGRFEGAILPDMERPEVHATPGPGEEDIGEPDEPSTGLPT